MAVGRSNPPSNPGRRHALGRVEQILRALSAPPAPAVSEKNSNETPAFSVQQADHKKIVEHLTFLDGKPPAFIDGLSEDERYYSVRQLGNEMMIQLRLGSYRDANTALCDSSVSLPSKLHFCCRLMLCWLRCDESGQPKLLSPKQIYGAAEVLFGTFSEHEKKLIEPVLRELPNLWKPAVQEKFPDKEHFELRDQFLDKMGLARVQGSTTADPDPGLAIENLFRRANEILAKLEMQTPTGNPRTGIQS